MNLPAHDAMTRQNRPNKSHRCKHTLYINQLALSFSSNILLKEACMSSKLVILLQGKTSSVAMLFVTSVWKSCFTVLIASVCLRACVLVCLSASRMP